MHEPKAKTRLTNYCCVGGLGTKHKPQNLGICATKTLERKMAIFNSLTFFSVANVDFALTKIALLEHWTSSSTPPMNRQIFSPFVLMHLSLSCICIVFFYGDKTSIVAHALSGFYMHGAAVMFGYSEYSELLHLESIRYFNHTQVLFFAVGADLEYCKAIQVFNH